MTAEIIERLKQISDRIAARQAHIELLEDVVATVSINLNRGCTGDDLRAWFEEENVMVKIRESQKKCLFPTTT